MTLSASNSAVSHTGSGALNITTAGTAVSVQGVSFTAGGDIAGVRSLSTSGTAALSSASPVTLTASAPTLQHSGSGALSIASAGTGVSVQGVSFAGGNLQLGAANTVSVGPNAVLQAQQPAVANGVDAVGNNCPACNATLVTVEEFNALVVTVNDLLARLRAHGLIAP